MQYFRQRLELITNKSQMKILSIWAKLFKTRASAQMVTDNPGRRHFLIIKYFKVNDNDIRQDTVDNVSL